MKAPSSLDSNLTYFQWKQLDHIYINPVALNGLLASSLTDLACLLEGCSQCWPKHGPCPAVGAMILFWMYWMLLAMLWIVLRLKGKLQRYQQVIKTDIFPPSSFPQGVCYSLVLKVLGLRTYLSIFSSDELDSTTCCFLLFQFVLDWFYVAEEKFRNSCYMSCVHIILED